MASVEQTAWIERVLDIKLSAPIRGPNQALQSWRSARESVVAQLRRLKAAIAASGDPEATPAQVLVDAIVKNLTPEPATMPAVAELERYLATDSIITTAERRNGFGIDVSIRTILSPPLRELRLSLDQVGT